MRSLFIFALLILGAISNAAIIKVGAEHSIKTIHKALEQAKNGDVIEVYSGVYTEGNILIDKSVHLKGIDRPVLDGEMEYSILTVSADSVTISGFKIINVGKSYTEDKCGIRMKRCDHFLVEDNILENNFFGIYLEKCHYGVVRNNTITGQAVYEMNSGNAIHLWHCKKIEVTDNQVLRHRDGIYFEFVDSSMVMNNLSEGNIRYGLHFMFSNDDAYRGNTFRDNGAGVAVMFSSRIDMRNNNFEFNWGPSSYGLLLKEINDAEIVGNVFRKNTVGIYVEGSNRINYKNNDIISNGWAFKIAGGCSDNVISENNFISNTFEVSMSSKMGSNTLDGNYWSSYSGYDLDKDGLGDVPYRPIKLFSYLVDRTPETIILLRSLFIDLLDLSEKVTPAFTPEGLKDMSPVMRRIS